MLSLLPTDLCLWQAHSMHSIILDLCLLLISAHEWPSLRQPVAAQFLLANSSQSPHQNWGFGSVAGNRARKYMCAHMHAYIQLQSCGLQGDRLCVINSILRGPPTIVPDCCWHHGTDTEPTMPMMCAVAIVSRGTSSFPLLLGRSSPL